MTAPESHPMTPEKLAEIRGHIERDKANEAAAEGIVALATLSAALDEANARAEAAVAMLRRLEWRYGYPDEWGNAPEECPICEGDKPGHAADCELDALLRKR